MYKKSLIIIGAFLLISSFLVIGWRVYSLIRFDGYFSPVYVYGLSNPYKYYQEHIGSLLLKYGEEYKLKPTIDENNLETYNVYRNDEHSFEFKYPKEYKIQTDRAFHPNISTSLTILNDKDLNNRCEILVMYKGWGVGRDWFPRRRRSIDWMITKHKKLRYFYAKNGQIVHTTNCGAPDLKLFEDRTALVDYIDKNSDRVYYVILGGEQCSDEVMTDILTTFQFIK